MTKPKTGPSDELSHHDVAQGVTTNPQDAGSGGNAPIGGHGQDSRTWTHGGPSHGNPATLSEREKRTWSSERGTRSTSSERETRSTHADGGAAEEQGDVAAEKPASDAQASPVPHGKPREKQHKPM
jgi:hypothetical protein